MNQVIYKIESKISEYKKEEDYKLITSQEKKTYTIFNEELKKLCWKLFPEIVRKNEKILEENREQEKISAQRKKGLNDNSLNQDQSQSNLQSSPANNNYFLWIIGGAMLLTTGIMSIYLLKRENK